MPEKLTFLKKHLRAISKTQDFAFMLLRIITRLTLYVIFRSPILRIIDRIVYPGFQITDVYVLCACVSNVLMCILQYNHFVQSGYHKHSGLQHQMATWFVYCFFSHVWMLVDFLLFLMNNI